MLDDARYAYPGPVTSASRATKLATMPAPNRLLSGFCTLGLLAASPWAQQSRSLQDDDLRPFAKSLAAYIAARDSTVGLDQAKLGLSASFEALGKDLEGKNPLSLAPDLGRALWLSRAYDELSPSKGKVTSEVFAHGSFAGAGMRFAYRIPKDYDPAEAYPLILAIPNEGEDPAQHIRTHWTLREVQDGALLLCPEMPAQREDWEQVMVRGRPGGLSHVLTGLHIAGQRFAVDFDRVFVAGFGKGVPAAVAAGNYSPQRFAGIIGRAGDAGDTPAHNFSNLPTLFTGAGAKARAFQEAAQGAGFDNCQLSAEGKEQDVWTWIGKQERQTHPRGVELIVGDPFPTQVYWLRVAPSAPDARAKATIDRDTNTVRIEGTGISHAILYLNDVLVDLDRPLRVMCNGSKHEALTPRSLSSTLELLYDGTSDAGCVYVAEVMFDMSSEAALSTGGATRADPEYDERFADASADVTKLWQLWEWCASTQREARGTRVLAKLLRLDPEHEGAREALGHRRSGSRWFTSQAALECFERSQDPETAQAKGHVQYKSLWLHPEERRLAAKGWVKNVESGQWISPSDRKQLAQGWVRQDLEWIDPEDAERVDEGLWHVDAEWFDMATANRRHAKIDAMWRIPSADVLLYSTADREVSLRAIEHMSRAIEDLRKVFGAEPVLPLAVALLRDEEQYYRFAFGDPDGRRLATHAGRLHNVHSAIFAESWFPRVDGKPEFRGMGVCYWDPLVPHGDLYGVHAARLAIGLSYADALDPSPKAVRKALAGRDEEFDYYATYEAEKRLPAWLRVGGAVYAERFFHDTSVASDGDAWWARKWSLENLSLRGGLEELSEVLAFRLDPDDRDRSLRLLIEAGLVVAFIVDGGCEPVMEAHAMLKRALASGRLHTNHVKALVEALGTNEEALRAFAGS